MSAAEFEVYQRETEESRRQAMPSSVLAYPVTKGAVGTTNSVVGAQTATALERIADSEHLNKLQ